MAIGSAEVLFKIKADSAQAEARIKAFKKELDEIQDAERNELTQLEQLAAASGITASSYTAMTGAVQAGAAALGVAAAAAAVATVALWKLVIATSEYGKAILTASIQTGLSVRTMSALKVAADQSGSSLDKITENLAEFNLLLASATANDEKAISTLARYGVTARDTDTALAQASRTIADLGTHTEQAAAAQALFGDESGEVLPIIRSFNGDLPGLIQKLDNLGVLLSEKDAKAAKQFADTLSTLKIQAGAIGRSFVSEFMPDITRALEAVSAGMVANKAAASEWGRSVSDTIHGIEYTMQAFSRAFDAWINHLTYGLIQQVPAWVNWSNGVRAAIAQLFPYLTTLLQLMASVGRLARGEVTAEIGGKASVSKLATGDIGGTLGSQVGARGAGSGGGGGGGASGPDPEQIRRQAIQAIERDHRQRLASWKAYLQMQEAALDASLTRGEISEAEHAKQVGQIKVRALLFEKQLNEELLKDARLNADEIKDLKVKQQVLDYNLGEERIKIGERVYAIIKKQTEQEIQDFEEAEKKRLAALKKRQQAEIDYSKWRRDQREARDPYGVGRQRRGAGGDIDWAVSGAGDLLSGVVTGLGAANEQMPMMQQMGQLIAETFTMVGEAVGQAARAFILFGTTGTTFRKIAAEIIASIAQTAVVQAIAEAAQGLAMLALFKFTGNPKYLASAKDHFASAAMWGMVAAVAVPVGRAVAGNAFNEATGGGGGGNSSDNDPNARSSFGTPFRGFGGGDTINRMSMVMAQTEETLHRLATRIDAMPPDHVVSLGAAGASRDIRDAYESELGNDVRATDAFMRRTGFAR